MNIFKRLISFLEIKINTLTGYKYRVNFTSKEVHYLPNKHKNCNLDIMSNYQNVTKNSADYYIHSAGFNGCRWCYTSEDNG